MNEVIKEWIVHPTGVFVDSYLKDYPNIEEHQLTHIVWLRKCYLNEIARKIMNEIEYMNRLFGLPTEDYLPPSLK